MTTSAGAARAAITVLIADDQAMVRAGFSALLAAQPDIDVLGEARDGAEAVAMVDALRPDVVLMDVRMPLLNGIEATRLITAAGESAPRVLMLTTFDIDDYVYDALRAGASGFLLKDALPEELVGAVRVVARGDALLDPGVTRRVIESFATAPGRPREAPAALAQLTGREREVLTEVAKGLSNGEIAESLFIAEQTVKTHVSRVFGKLGIRDRAQAVIVAYESGLVVAGSPS
ncbi:response regulator transcription factor [Herbiconiux sp. L3-i23]|uniref:response regulator n=1 Tax=Herbiconiux sp. L3-i23 TaxID=2905871 RepID=UPI00206F8794|nr:response regulator transcription factor [Herbiconiux sp. L3-i23]BDI22345.1 DNA-binding response regulator [Herbiconiux sp. L3-i23]